MSIRMGKIFYLYVTKGLFWFRFFSKIGIHGKNFKKYPLIWSDRYGDGKVFIAGNWRFKILN